MSRRYGVGSTASCPSPQLRGPSAYCCRGAGPVQCLGERSEDFVVSAEVGEVRERQVNGTADGSVPAEILQLGSLAVST